MRRIYLLVLLLAAVLTDPEIVREAMSLLYNGALLSYKETIGSYLFLFAFRAIPFLVIGVLVWRAKEPQPIFVGGILSTLALILWATWELELPLFKGGHYSSTSSIAYLWIPVFAVPAALAGALSAIGITARRRQRS